MEEHRKDVPPGWEPNVPSYPLKLYQERVRLWYRVYDGADENVGPLLAGRLRGRARQVALGLRLQDPHGHIDIGDAALVRLSVEEVRDPTSGQIIQHAIPSGVQALMTALRAAFGEADQLQATRALETFFEVRRNRMSIPEWSVQWQLNLDEAITHSGLDLNNVAKTYLYFKSSGLAQKSLDDILLQVHGDMRRFDEARTLMLRMAHRNLDHGSSSHYEECREDDGSWSAVTDYWSEDGYITDDLYAWYESDWNYSPWDYETAETYYEDWPAEHYDYGWDDEEPQQAEGDEHQPQETNPEESGEYFKGKGKGRSQVMGLGCSTCGSKWHNTHSCPMNDSYKGKNPTFGKGKPKGFNKGKGKSYGGKSYGKPYRKGYGKSKSYGKKGYMPYGSKQGRKGFWLEEMPKGYNDHYGGAYLMSNNTSPEKDEKDTLDKIIIQDTFNQIDPLPARRVRFNDQPETEQIDIEVNSKKLNFPVVEENEMIFHQVRGRRIRGLLVDPGASSGLIGSETLRDLLASGMVPPNKVKDITWNEASTTVTGISGQADATLTRISIPFQIGSEDAEYTADVIGGEGSNCPALLPNGSLRQLRTAMMTQWYDNGDGVMLCSLNGLRPDDPQASLVVMKLLLAESGHYILPVNKEDQDMTPEEQNAILRLWQGRHGHTAACEQSNSDCNFDAKNNKTNYDVKPNNVENFDNSENFKQKLQFTTETEPKDVADIMDEHQSNNNINKVKVADDEPAIQVLKSDNMDEEYDESQQAYTGDQFPAHLKTSKLRYLSQLYRAIPA